MCNDADGHPQCSAHSKWKSCRNTSTTTITYCEKPRLFWGAFILFLSSLSEVVLWWVKEAVKLVLGSIQTVCVVLLARCKEYFFTHFVSLFCLFIRLSSKSIACIFWLKLYMLSYYPLLWYKFFWGGLHNRTDWITMQHNTNTSCVFTLCQ